MNPKKELLRSLWVEPGDSDPQIPSRTRALSPKSSPRPSEPKPSPFCEVLGFGFRL